MKQENVDAPGNPQDKRQKKSSTARRKKDKEQAENIRLPFLLEFTYTASALILLVVALMVMITSFLAGASIFTIVIRTGVAIAIMGCLLMFISSQISSGLMFSVKIDQEEEQRKQEEAALSMNDENLTMVEA
jgi:low affinity Fe/Cu permease